ncbi:MAG: WD40 repeat domain-containing protein [Acidobacteriota bacterium]|nr:WD40 repeat domain-containing protein [Acidobacteriota bacterium]
MKTCPQCDTSYPNSFAACPIHGCRLELSDDAPPDARGEKRKRQLRAHKKIDAKEDTGQSHAVWISVVSAVVLVLLLALGAIHLLTSSAQPSRADDQPAGAMSAAKGAVDSGTVVAFSPDRRRLVSGSLDSEVKLWNLDNGEVLRTFQGQTGWIESLAFSPDGRTVASGTVTGAVKLWNVVSGELERTLQDNSGKVDFVAFSPDGQTLASAFCFADSAGTASSPNSSGTSSGTIELWDLTSGQMVRTVQEHAPCAVSLAFSPDGRTLTSGNADDTIKLWDIASGGLTKTLRGQDASATSLAFSPVSRAGHVLASGSSNGTINIWNVADGTVIRALRGHKDTVTAVIFSSSGHILASVSRDKTAKLWNAMNGNLLRTLDDPTGPIFSVAFNRDGLALVSGADDRTIRVWDLTGIED